MCGICGEIRFDGDRPSPETLASMMAALAARGPDGAGMVIQDNIGLGHQRLKIIDLSERAQQPMVDGHLGLSGVYNGAIYNYPALREELMAMGYRFFSTGDTEVILKAYHAWGEDCVTRFNGMFALAIRERDTGRLFLARDRLGIKPLYYARHSRRFRFASSLPALVAAGGLDTDIDPVALHYYMTFHSVVPPPHTIVKGVRKLPPASVMTIEPDGEIRERSYWRLDFGPTADDAGATADDWRAGLRRELDAAIRRRLTADVPVGVLLSGGLDSSLVVALLAEAGQRDLSTFSIGFESVGGESGDEFEYSDIVAERFGTDHHRIQVDSRRVLPAIEPCVRAMSEPMVSHDCVGFYLLSQEVARHVKVVQSGQGADEVFAGYHWYPPMMDSGDESMVADYVRGFFDGDQTDFARAVNPRFLGSDHSREFVRRHFEQPGAETPIDRTLRLDTTVMLVDDPVKRVDNMTMAWGLEARVPFLDHELVAYAARMPAELKVEDGGKGVLKSVAREVLPSAVIDRPKGYFPVPALKYLQGEYLDFVQDVLQDPAARARELFNPGYVAEAMEAPDAHITRLGGSRLWQMALLAYWCGIHRIA